MLPKAILLDLDDTITTFDYGIDLDACWKNACVSRFPAWSKEAVDEAVQAIKERARWYWSDAERHRTGRLRMDETRRYIVETALMGAGLLTQYEASSVHPIADDYGRSRDAAIRPFPGAIETLEHIRARGIKLALITNGSSRGQRSKINRFALPSYFDDIFVEEECGVGKPEHAIYQMVLNRLQVEPDETWMAGDNFEWEVAAPQRLGIKGIWINHRRQDTASLSMQPFHAVTTLSDLVQLLDASDSR